MLFTHGSSLILVLGLEGLQQMISKQEQSPYCSLQMSSFLAP